MANLINLDFLEDQFCMEPTASIKPNGSVQSNRLPQSRMNRNPLDLGYSSYQVDTIARSGYRGACLRNVSTHPTRSTGPSEMCAASEMLCGRVQTYVYTYVYNVYIYIYCIYTNYIYIYIQRCICMYILYIYTCVCAFTMYIHMIYVI